MYLVAEPVRLVFEVFGACDKRCLSKDVAQKCLKFDGFTLLLRLIFVTFLLFKHSHFSDIFTIKVKYLVFTIPPTVPCQFF